MIEGEGTIPVPTLMDDKVTEDMEVELRSAKDFDKTQKKKHPVPFSATFKSKALVVPPQPNPSRCGTGFPIVNVEQTLSGKATHLGRISVTISSCADVSTSPPTFPEGMITLKAANGDFLYFELDPGSSEFNIDGGTGRFKYATGRVTASFEVIGLGEFINYLEGEIQY